MRARWLPLLFAIGCAAGGAPKQAAERAAQEPTRPDRPEGAAYERILPSFSVAPRGAVILDPRSATRYVRNLRSKKMAWLVDQFAAKNARHGEAVARVDYAALLWLDGRPRRAYEEVTKAQALFADVGDVEGLAHTYEWLGYMFLESGVVDRAAEHFGVAYRLFGSVENEDAQTRVLSYATE